MPARKRIRDFLEIVMPHEHINNVATDNHLDELIVVVPLLEPEIPRPRLLQVVATFTLQECGMILPGPHPRDHNILALLSPIDWFVSFWLDIHQIIIVIVVDIRV